MGIAIQEPWHLSFPNVFYQDGEWYMLPEMDASGEMRIYRATDFPMHWEVYAKPFTGQSYADPMIYRKDGIYYLWFNTARDGDDLRLYYSDRLNADWTEHPASPIRRAGDDTRPAGRISELNGELLYFVQEHDNGYGTGTIAYRIETLTTTEYKDTRLDDNPILHKYGEGWAKHGMHHLSFVKKQDGQYLCVTDGLHAALHWRWDWLNMPQFFLHK